MGYSGLLKEATVLQVETIALIQTVKALTPNEGKTIKISVNKLSVIQAASSKRHTGKTTQDSIDCLNDPGRTNRVVLQWNKIDKDHDPEEKSEVANKMSQNSL